MRWLAIVRVCFGIVIAAVSSQQQNLSSGSKIAWRVLPTTIAVCDVNIGSKTFSLQMQHSVYQNHHNYSLANNYSFYHQVELLGQEQSPYYTKIHLVKNLLSPPHSYKWILLIDSDALFVNNSITIESIISIVHARTTLSHTPSLIFSGDTNAINTGLLLFRRSRWTIELLDEILRMSVVLQKMPKIGMGGDNAAFAMYLGGCTSNCTLDEFKAAYLKSDYATGAGNRENKAKKYQITTADMTVFEKIVAPQVLPHIFPLPQSEFQTYVIEDAKYVVHFAGLGARRKEVLLADALAYLQINSQKSPV